MLEALGVTLLGAGIFAVGVLLQPFYDIGVVVILVGMIGVTVRGVSWLRWILRTYMAAEPRE